MAMDDPAALNDNGLTADDQDAVNQTFATAPTGAAPPAPGAFAGMWKGLAGIPSGAAHLGLDIYGDVNAGLRGAVDKLTGAHDFSNLEGLPEGYGAGTSFKATPETLRSKVDEAADETAQQVADLQSSVTDTYRPDPSTTGIVGQQLFGLADTLTRVGLGTILTRGTAGTEVAAGSIGQERAQDLEAQGVDPGTAAESGALSAASFEAMGAAGGEGSLAARVLKSMGANVGADTANRALDSEVLRNAGYSDLASQEQWNDARSIMADLVIGAAFPLVHEGYTRLADASATRAEARLADKITANPELFDKLRTNAGYVPAANVDAALTALNSQHAADVAPGIPTDPRSQGLHLKALDAAIMQVARGDDVHVDPIVRGMNTIERPMPVGLPEAVDEVFNPRGPMAASEADLARLDELRQRRAGTTPLTGEELGEFADLSERDRLTARIAGSGARLPGVLNMEAFNPADHGHVGFVDADNFKQINDRLGHATGDELIQNIGQILSQEAAPGTVFHRGGDEFLLSGDQHDVDDVMQRVNGRLAQRVLEVTGSDGQTHQRSVFLSHGVGENEADAERQLHATKAERLAAGLRTERRASERPDDAGRRDQGTAGAGRPADAHPAGSEATADLNLASGVSASGTEASIRSSDAAYGTPDRHPWVEVDTSKNIPLAGGVSQDGRTIYVSPYMPKTVDVGGKTIDATEAVVVHEVEEQKVMHPDGPKDVAYMKALRADIKSEGAKVPKADLEKVKRGEPLDYPNAHRIATIRENAFIRKKYGIDPEKYQRALADGIETARKKAALEGNIPADLDTKPYEDTGLTKLLPDDAGAADAMRQADEDVAEAGRLAAGIKAAVQCFLSYGSELT